ncbi:zinc finger protein 37-like [Planococcus citri]|uniref:zinc finger protein 37-like n=1 Tax=Planococcus citri TaxID=170843 RepID=UPI0031F84A7E
MSRKRKEICIEKSLDDYIDACVNNISLFDRFSEEKSEKRSTLQNTKCSSDFQRNTTTANAPGKRLGRNFKDITNNQKTIPPKTAKLTSKKNLKLGKCQLFRKNFRSEIFRLKIRCFRLEDALANLREEIKQQVEECFVTRANTAGNVARGIQNSTSSINASSENSRHNLCNSEARTDQRSEEDALVESAEQVLEDGYTTDSSMPSLQISSDDDPDHNIEENPEQFSKEVTHAKHTDEDNHSPNSTIPPSEKRNETRNADEVQTRKRSSEKAGYSKHEENVSRGPITRSAKKSKNLSSVKKSTKNSSNVSNKVVVRMRNSFPYRCDICGAMFSYKRDWTRHQQREHTKPFHCQVCDKQFAYKSSLIEHGFSHDEKKCYKCRLCDTRFKHNYSKLRHESMHVDRACFECPDCGKKFSYKHNLITHLKLHSGVKPFSCQTCSESFAQKGNLTRHQQTHSEDNPFKCRICNQQFKDKSSCTTHENIHVEGPRFECAHCGKKFTSKLNLANHINVHYKYQ